MQGMLSMLHCFATQENGHNSTHKIKRFKGGKVRQWHVVHYDFSIHSLNLLVN